MYKFVTNCNENVVCRPFTNIDPDYIGIDVYVNGERMGSMVSIEIPDEEDSVAVLNFENEVEDWLVNKVFG